MSDTPTTLAECESMLASAMADYEADCGAPGDEVWFELVVATCHLILITNPDLAREFCRTQIGSIPQDLEPYLGKKDQ